MVEPGETKRYRTCDKNGRKVESRHRSRDSDFAECARTCRGRPAGGRGGTSVKNEKKGEQHVITKNVKATERTDVCEIPDHPVCTWHLPVFHLLVHLFTPFFAPCKGK